MNGWGPSNVICKLCTLKKTKIKYTTSCRQVRTKVMGGYDSTRERGLMGVLRGFEGFS